MDLESIVKSALLAKAPTLDPNQLKAVIDTIVTVIKLVLPQYATQVEALHQLIDKLIDLFLVVPKFA